MSQKQKFCPECGSRDVKPAEGAIDVDNPLFSTYMAGDINNFWECRECGYTGMMPEGDSEELADNSELEPARFCPDCGSKDVEPSWDRTNLAGRDVKNSSEWKCNNCGYKGLMPIGDPEETEADFEDTELKSAGENLEAEPIDYRKLFSFVMIAFSLLIILYFFLT